MVLVLLILLPVRYSIEKKSLFPSGERSPEWAENMKALKSGMK